MPFKPIRFTPGIVRDTTMYSNGGSRQPGWWDCDKIRFRMGFPETIGGWVRASASAIVGIVRNLFTWTLLSGDQLLAIGSEKTISLLTAFGMFDITPIVGVSTPGQMNGTMHGITGYHLVIMPRLPGATDGEVITIENAGSGPTGIPTQSQIDGRWVILPSSLVQAVYPPFNPATEMAVDVTAGGGSYFVNSAFFGGPTTVVRLYAGPSAAQSGGEVMVGWGSGAWGENAWGGDDVTSPSTTVHTLPNTVSFDNFGQDLLFCWRNGPIYIWQVSSGYDLTGLGASGRAIPIANMAGANEVPITAYEIMVSEQTRVVLAFGTNTIVGGGPTFFDPLLFRWSDQENYLDWEPRPDNAAGELHLQGGSIFITAVNTRREILAWTDRSLNSIQFIGGDLVFGVEVIARSTSIAGPNAKIAIDDDVFWMGVDGFYHYSGVVKVMPCSVMEYVFSNVDPQFMWKIACAYEPAFNEIKWFYPSVGQNADEPDPTKRFVENDRYVSVNRLDGSWSIGRLPRTAWLHRAFAGYTADNSMSGRSAGASLDGYIYAHEVGQNDGSTNPASPLGAYITSSPIEIADGDKFVTIWRMLPDITFRNSAATTPQALFIWEGIDQPGGGITQAKGNDIARTTSAVVVEEFTEIAYLRLRSRMARLTVLSDAVDVSWRLGTPRIDGREDGRR